MKEELFFFVKTLEGNLIGEATFCGRITKAERPKSLGGNLV